MQQKARNIAQFTLGVLLFGMALVYCMYFSSQSLWTGDGTIIGGLIVGDGIMPPAVDIGSQSWNGLEFNNQDAMVGKQVQQESIRRPTVTVTKTVTVTVTRTVTVRVVRTVTVTITKTITITPAPTVDSQGKLLVLQSDNQ